MRELETIGGVVARQVAVVALAVASSATGAASAGTSTAAAPSTRGSARAPAIRTIQRMLELGVFIAHRMDFRHEFGVGGGEGGDGLDQFVDRRSLRFRRVRQVVEARFELPEGERGFILVAIVDGRVRGGGAGSWGARDHRIRCVEVGSSERLGSLEITADRKSVMLYRSR